MMTTALTSAQRQTLNDLLSNAAEDMTRDELIDYLDSECGITQDEAKQTWDAFWATSPADRLKIQDWATELGFPKARN